MNPFLQGLLNNTPVLLALFILFYMIKKLEFKMDNEFKLVRSEMKAGFLEVNNHLKRHDREIKGIKKRLGRVEKRLTHVENKIEKSHNPN